METRTQIKSIASMLALGMMSERLIGKIYTEKVMMVRERAVLKQRTFGK